MGASRAVWSRSTLHWQAVKATPPRFAGAAGARTLGLWDLKALGAMVPAQGVSIASLSFLQ